MRYITYSTHIALFTVHVAAQSINRVGQVRVCQVLIELAVVTPFSQHCHLVIDIETHKVCVVDPGGNAETIYGIASSYHADIESVFVTHSHLDHAGGVKRLLSYVEEVSSSRPVLAVHPLEKEIRASIPHQARMFGMPEDEFEACPEPDRLVEDGDLFTIGSISATVIFVPGHSPGHVVLYFSSGPVSIVDENGSEQEHIAPVLISGDTLFSGSIGRTDLPGGRYTDLINSIRSKLFALPDDTIVLPGHGPMTTIGREKRTNPFLAGD
jgi:hydroxyacylglutathione hydrolase